MILKELKAVFELSVDEDSAILACVLLTQYQHVTDRRTDGRTDGQADISTIASVVLCIASYAHAL